MSHWVRLWDDMPTDPKWRVVARRSGRSIAEVIAVFNFMMLNAGANATERNGTLTNFDDEDVAAALDIDACHVTSIREAMQGKTLDGDRLTGWERRQPKREDGAAERAKAWREKKKLETDGCEQPTERKRTQANAEERPEQIQSRADTEELSSLRSDSAQAPLPAPEKPKKIKKTYPEEFSRFYAAYPRKTGPDAAQVAFNRAVLKGGSPEEIIHGALQYAAEKAGTETQFVKQPSTWLNAGCWKDYAQTAPPKVLESPSERAKRLLNGFNGAGGDGRFSQQPEFSRNDVAAQQIATGRLRDNSPEELLPDAGRTGNWRSSG